MSGTNGKTKASEKPPMLLLHGFTGTPVMWDPLLPFLREHHECVALNLPGHHGGPEFTEPGGHIADAIADRVELQMDELGWERAHIVGNSLGGWLALILAQRRRALTTVALAPAGGWELDSYESRRVIKLFKQMQKGLDHFGPLAIELAKRPRGRKIILRDALAYPERLPGPLAVEWMKAAMDTPAWKILLQYAPVVNAPKTMDGLEGPVRIAWGTRDRIIPFKRYSPGWKAVLPDADWVKLEGLGHVPMSDNPALVAQTILEISTASTQEVVEPD